MNNNNFFDNTDNSATVAPGTDVSFPQDGPNSGTRPVSAHLTIMRIM